MGTISVIGITVTKNKLNNIFNKKKLSKIRALKPRVRMAEHVMLISFRMHNVFVKKALRGNSVKLRNDQQLKQQLKSQLKRSHIVS